MTVPNADPALVIERLRALFRGQVLDTFLLYLFTYEMPIDRCRSLLDKVATQALLGFPDLAHASWRADAAGELRERLLHIENSSMAKIERACDRRQTPAEHPVSLPAELPPESPSVTELSRQEPPGTT